MDLIRNITPTSCQAERLFSKAGLCQGKLRNRMLSKLFEARMMLKENKDYWLNEYDENYVVRNDRGYRMMQRGWDIPIEDASAYDDSDDE